MTFDATDYTPAEIEGHIQELEEKAEQARNYISALERDCAEVSRQWHEAEDRITKAKTILAESVKRECGTFETRYYFDEIKAALDALEGK